MDGRAQAGKTWYLAWLVTTDDLVGVGLIRSKLPEGWPESAGGPPSSSYGLLVSESDGPIRYCTL
jgi:hypothetical protein